MNFVHHLMAIDLTWAAAADFLLGAPLRILLTVVLAWVARYLVHRAISSAVDQALARREATRARRDHHGRDRGAAAGERYRQRMKTTWSLLRSIATFVIIVLTVLTVLSLLHIPLAPLLASAGVGGVALGFGAQSLVRDYLSGVFMILEDQYGVGDYIDAGEAGGSVEAATLPGTRLRALDGVAWCVRNRAILRVGNRSQGWSTVMVALPSSYREATARVIGIIRAQVEHMDRDPQWHTVLREAPSV